MDKVNRHIFEHVKKTDADELWVKDGDYIVIKYHRDKYFVSEIDIDELTSETKKEYMFTWIEENDIDKYLRELVDDGWTCVLMKG